MNGKTILIGDEGSSPFLVIIWTETLSLPSAPSIHNPYILVESDRSADVQRIIELNLDCFLAGVSSRAIH